VLSGPIKIPRQKSTAGTNLATHVLGIQKKEGQRTVHETLSVEFQRLWDLDAIGIRARDSVYENFLRNMKFQDGRYIVGLPWKEHHKVLQLNYDNSLQRLNGQMRKLKKDPTSVERV